MRPTLILSGLCLGLAVAAGAADFSFNGMGELVLVRPSIAVLPWAMRPDHSIASLVNREAKSPVGCKLDGRMEFDSGKGVIALKSACRAREDGAIEFQHDVKILREVELSGMGDRVSLDVRDFAGSTWCGDTGAKGVFPAEKKSFSLGGGKMKSVAVRRADGREFVFESSLPMSVSLFDNRIYRSDSYAIRLVPHRKGVYRKGERFSWTLIVREAGVRSSVTDAPLLRIEENDDWVKFDNRRDVVAGSALDFRALVGNDAPAGKHGWLKVKDGKFVFEGLPDRPQRFNGVNLCFAANVPEKRIADRLAPRLARLGYNSVRIHHHERSIMAKGKGPTAFNPDALDRFDYLVSKLIGNGLYLTTDLYVSRDVPWREIGVDRAGNCPMNSFKALVALGYQPALANYQAYVSAFLGHVNPYTGRAYKDEPALALLCMINEGHLGNTLSGVKGMPEVKETFRTWLAAKRAANPGFYPFVSDDVAKFPGMRGDDNAPTCIFVSDMEAANARRLTAWLRSIGCKALLTDDNNQPHYAPKSIVRANCYDYVDDHSYTDHPKFLGPPWSVPMWYANGNPLHYDEFQFTRAACTRVWGLPFTITEWNYAGVGDRRTMGGLLMGALAARQDWDGLWHFAYAHGLRALPGDAEAHPSNFDLADDPVKQAGDRFFAALFLRRDMEPLAQRLSLDVTPDAVDPGTPAACYLAPKWRDRVVWNARIGNAPADRAVPDARRFPLRDWCDATNPPCVFAAAPGMDILPDGSFAVTSARTCGGYAEKGVEISAGAFSFRPLDERATAGAISLDGKPLATSERILALHLVDVQARGAVYAEETRNTMIKAGNAGCLIRRARAEISLALLHPEGYSVHALATDGTRLGEVPAKTRNGRLVFTAESAGRFGGVLHYEIVKQTK